MTIANIESVRPARRESSNASFDRLKSSLGGMIMLGAYHPNRVLTSSKSGSKVPIERVVQPTFSSTGVYSVDVR